MSSIMFSSFAQWPLSRKTRNLAVDRRRDISRRFTVFAGNSTDANADVNAGPTRATTHISAAKRVGRRDRTLAPDVRQRDKHRGEDMKPRKCYTNARRDWPSSKGAKTSTEPAKRAKRGCTCAGGRVGMVRGGWSGGVPSRCVVIFMRAIPLLLEVGKFCEQHVAYNFILVGGDYLYSQYCPKLQI